HSLHDALPILTGRMQTESYLNLPAPSFISEKIIQHFVEGIGSRGNPSREKERKTSPGFSPMEWNCRKRIGTVLLQNHSAYTSMVMAFTGPARVERNYTMIVFTFCSMRTSRRLNSHFREKTTHQNGLYSSTPTIFPPEKRKRNISNPSNT